MRAWIFVLLTMLAVSGFVVRGEGGYGRPAGGAGAAGEGGAAKDVPSVDALYALNGTHKGAYMGSACEVLDVTAVANGKSGQLFVPNEPPMGGYNPSSIVQTAIKDAKAGDVFRIKTSSIMGSPVVNQIRRYDTKPGETSANAFVFVDTKEDKGVTEVEVTKFEQPATLVVQMKKDESGKMAPDPAIMTAVGTAKGGDVVVITVRGFGAMPTINTFEVWVAPTQGEFSKLGEADVNGEKRPAVVLKDGDSEVSIQIPGVEKQGHWIPDAKVLAEVHKLKAKQAVEYHTAKEGDIDTLKDIAPSTSAQVSAK